MKIFYFLKAILLFVGMLTFALLILVFGLPWWGNPKLNWVFIQTFSRYTCLLVGVKMRYVDAEKVHLRRPVVFVGNHQSALDFAFIGSVIPSYGVVVAKREIQYVPIFGWFFKVAGNLLIDRSNKKGSLEQISKLAGVLIEKNIAASVFPEGTRNKASNEILLPFKKGAFFMAISKGLPIIPVVCSSLKGIAVWERFELGGGSVIVKILDPIETKNISMSEMSAFMERVRTLMQTELNALNALVRAQTNTQVKEAVNS